MSDENNGKLALGQFQGKVLEALATLKQQADQSRIDTATCQLNVSKRFECLETKVRQLEDSQLVLKTKAAMLGGAASFIVWAAIELFKVWKG